MLAVIVLFVPHLPLPGQCSKPTHWAGGGFVWFVQTPLQGSVVHEIRT